MADDKQLATSGDAVKSYWDELKAAAQEGVASGNRFLQPVEQGVANAVVPGSGLLINNNQTPQTQTPINIPLAKETPVDTSTSTYQPPDPTLKPLQYNKPSTGGELSPEDQAEKSFEQTDTDRELTLNKREETLKEQQNALKSGYAWADHLQTQADLDDQLRQHQIEADTQIADNHAKLQSDQDEKDAQDLMNTQIDPNHWYKKAGTAGSILAAIAIAGGAFAAAMPHTNNNQNQALGIINNAIDRDVDAQKATLENKYRALNLKMNKHDKDQIRDHWMLEQESRIADRSYVHAIGLASQARQSATDQNSILGLNNLISDLQDQRDQIKDNRTNRILKVMQIDRARAQAVANANNAENIRLQRKVEDTAKDIFLKGGVTMDQARSLAARSLGLTTQGNDMALPKEGENAVDPAQVKRVTDALKGLKELYSNPLYANTPEGRGKFKAYANEITLGLPFLQSGSRRLMEQELNMNKDLFGTNDLIKSDILGERRSSIDTILQSLDSDSTGPVGIERK